MIKGKKIVVFLLCIAISLPALAWADEAAQLRKKIMFDQKKLIVMENMEFTADEGTFFWPVFDEIQNELFETDQRAAKLIVAYASAYQTLTDDQAAKIVAEFFDIQKSRTAVLEKYMQKLSKGLPVKKVFRYLQVENKLESIARYELAKEIPLAQ
ncbi:MAG: hypothetical protein JRF02_03600 [Deltaproteobacteria bacterium]|jgi:hypothetical protein|nr:hypothetical protein [Deltaproteobacteria bacterium]